MKVKNIFFGTFFGVFLIIIMLIIVLFSGSNKPYFVGCKSFPYATQISDWEKKNHLMLTEIIKISEFSYDTETCPGKFGVVIFYNNYNEKKKIDAIIRDIFFIDGVPYRMVNL